MDRIQEGVKITPSKSKQQKNEEKSMDFFDMIEEDDKTDAEIMALKQDLKILKQQDFIYDKNLQE